MLLLPDTDNIKNDYISADNGMADNLACIPNKWSVLKHLLWIIAITL